MKGYLRRREWDRENGGFPMMYPFLTLDDDTEITHSEMRKDGSVKGF